MKNSLFIIDGNNVVYYNSKQPRLQQLIILTNELKEFVRVMVVVSQELQFRIDDKKGLLSLIKNKKILQTPKGVDMDRFILEIANKTQGIIISNDCFKQYKREYNYEISRRLPFMIIKTDKGKYQPILPWLEKNSSIGGNYTESTLLSA